jgi:glycosyltransferase involved in cell wall biosynthesis
VGGKIAKAKHDLVIIRFWIPFMGPCLGTIARRIRANGHSKVLVLADNVVPHEARPADKWLTNYLLKSVHGALTLSSFVTEQLRRFSAMPVRTLHHPLYDNFGEPQPAKEARQKLHLAAATPTLLFFGFIRKYKGLDLLLEALCRADLQARDWQLLIAGEFYEKADEYRAWQENPLLKNRVHWYTQFIANSEVATYFSAADFVVQPYRSATQSGVTPLAYHFSKPMLVTEVGALPEMVPSGSVGEVAEPTVEGIAAGLLRLLHHGPEHYLPGIAEQKRKFSWAVFVEEVQEFASTI